MKLLFVNGFDPSEDKITINSNVPIVAAGGIIMTLSKCPTGQGSGLYNHLATFEILTVRARVYY